MNTSKALLSAFVTCALTATGFAQVNNYVQDFESLDASSPSALGDDGWVVGANVFDSSGGYLYNYFAFPAPNGSGAFCNVASNEGGPDQGAQQLVVFNDYNNGDHAVGHLIEANVFREYTITAEDVGRPLIFSFDAKMGDLQAPTTATAFIKIINTTTWFLDDADYLDLTNIPNTWANYQVSMTIDSSWVGSLFQIGFMNYTSNYTPSGVVYDNIRLGEFGVSPGSPYCLGDGGGTVCPCGNNGSNGGGCANGSGDGCVLTTSGTDSVSAGDLVLSASNAIPSQPGLYFQGNNAVNNANGNIFGDGLRCAGGGVIRLQVRFSDGSGGSATNIDIGARGGVSAGDVKRYQLWYRDPNTSPCGAQFNLSNGIEITWTA